MYVFLFLSIVFALANSVDPDEMPQYAAFHLGLTVCQSRHIGVTSIQWVKDGDGLLVPVSVVERGGGCMDLYA